VTGLDPFLGGSGGDGLADGPVQSFDEPCVAGQGFPCGFVDFGDAFVDAAGEFVGESKLHTFRHVSKDSTMHSASTYARMVA
jgi:hypothetical protein